MGSFLSSMPTIQIKSKCCENTNNSFTERQCKHCKSIYRIPIESKKERQFIINELSNQISEREIEEIQMEKKMSNK